MITKDCNSGQSHFLAELVLLHESPAIIVLSCQPRRKT